MERRINGGEEKLIDGHGSCRCDGNDKGGADGARREAYTAVDVKVGWRFFGRDRITPLSVIMKGCVETGQREKDGECADEGHIEE